MEMYGKFFPSNDATKEKTTFEDIFALTSMGIFDNMHEVKTVQYILVDKIITVFPFLYI
jgi:hypothetical protein